MQGANIQIFKSLCRCYSRIQELVQMLQHKFRVQMQQQMCERTRVQHRSGIQDHLGLEAYKTIQAYNTSASLSHTTPSGA